LWTLHSITKLGKVCYNIVVATHVGCEQTIYGKGIDCWAYNGWQDAGRMIVKAYLVLK